MARSIAARWGGVAGAVAGPTVDKAKAGASYADRLTILFGNRACR